MLSIIQKDLYIMFDTYNYVVYCGVSPAWLRLQPATLETRVQIPDAALFFMQLWYSLVITWAFQAYNPGSNPGSCMPKLLQFFELQKFDQKFFLFFLSYYFYQVFLFFSSCFSILVVLFSIFYVYFLIVIFYFYFTIIFLINSFTFLVFFNINQIQ